MEKEELIIEEKPNKKKTVEELHGKIKNCIGLNIRSEASLTSKPLGVLSLTSDFIIHKKGSTKDFYKITYGEISGYCLKEYVESYSVEKGE